MKPINTFAATPMNTLQQVPIQAGLFTDHPTSPQLIGGCCTQCGRFHFPVQANCPYCAALSVEPTPLSRRGSLWTWTIQTFAPPVPPYRGPVEDFVPFGVGYIELPEGLRVQGRLTVNDPEQLSIGMPMELTLQAFGVDEEGREVLIYAFAPAAA
jgi:uncharacterized OB-fold protein